MAPALILKSAKQRPLLPEGILTAGPAASVPEVTGLCIQMPLDHPKSARRRRLNFNHHFSSVALSYGTGLEIRKFKIASGFARRRSYCRPRGSSL